MYGGKVNSAMLIIAMRNLTRNAKAPNIVHATVISTQLRIG